MALTDYPGLILLGVFILFVVFAIYKDAKSSTPINPNLKKIHTITQGPNLTNENVERDNKALNKLSEKHK